MLLEQPLTNNGAQQGQDDIPPPTIQTSTWSDSRSIWDGSNVSLSSPDFLLNVVENDRVWLATWLEMNSRRTACLLLAGAACAE